MMDDSWTTIAAELAGPLKFAPVPPLKATPEPANGALLLTFDDPARTVRRHVLNSTGRAVYGLLDGETTVAEIINAFTERFPDVPRNQLEKDIIMLLRLMQRKGVIRQVPKQAAPVEEAN
jgi:hypothetical protein